MRHGNTLCQICDAPKHPGSPRPLCRSCLIAAYEYVKECIKDATTAAPRRAGRTLGSVYYVRLSDRVKIGTSVDPVARIRAMALPRASLIAVEPGGIAMEQVRHQQFDHLRITGSEWFHAAPDLLDHIAVLASTAA